MLHVLVTLLSVLFLALVAPVLLDRMTRHGCHPRGAVAAWLVLCLSAPVALLGAVTLLALVATSHPAGNHLGGSLVLLEHPAWRLAFAVLALALVIRTSAVVVSEFRRTAVVRERHRDRLRLVRLRDTPHSEFDVIASAIPAAYCVPGCPHRVVVSTGALAALDRDQLAAVLAHERAHLAGHHHVIVTLMHALRRAMPFFPALRRAEAAVGYLLELCADDTAVRAHSRTTVASALTALAQRPVPAPALGAAGPTTAMRVSRLLTPARRRGARAVGMASTLVAMVVAALLPGAVVLTAGCCLLVFPFVAHLAAG